MPRRLLLESGSNRLLRAQQGSMAVEMVLLTPLLIAFALLVVAGGRYVALRGEVESAVNDAARAASLQRDLGSAAAKAQSAVAADLPAAAVCGSPSVGGSNFTAGGSVTVSIQCTVSYSQLGLLGLPGSAPLTSRGVSPIDVYRRTG